MFESTRIPSVSAPFPTEMSRVLPKNCEPDLAADRIQTSRVDVGGEAALDVLLYEVGRLADRLDANPTSSEPGNGDRGHLMNPREPDPRGRVARMAWVGRPR